MKIWLISDTHNEHRHLIPPDEEHVDMVIHAGDAGVHKEPSVNSNQIADFLDWFKYLPYKYKVWTPGNHDTSVERNYFKEQLSDGVITLIEDSVEIEGLKIYGSPYTPAFGHGWAYNCSRGTINRHWSLIPLDTDILITHGPPCDILDANDEGIKCGCSALRKRLKRVKPKLHVFGHIHEQGGRTLEMFDFPTKFVNAATVDLKHHLVNNGKIVEI